LEKCIENLNQKVGDNMSEKLTYSVKEAADLIGISVPKMYETVKIEGFPVVRFGRKIVIPKAEFKEWLSREARGEHGQQ
jgi:excisionase family DNA binding protein